jgi:hypothetical protein
MRCLALAAIITLACTATVLANGNKKCPSCPPQPACPSCPLSPDLQTLRDQQLKTGCVICYGCGVKGGDPYRLKTARGSECVSRNRCGPDQKNCVYEHCCKLPLHPSRSGYLVANRRSFRWHPGPSLVTL